MAEKDRIVVEISPDSWEDTKYKSKQLKLEGEEEEDGTPVRAVFCLKSRHDLKRYEETEDCFILDFDPSEPLDIRKISFSDDLPDIILGDCDLAIIHEKGEVACRDFPHPRHLCWKYPFGATPHSTHCSLCYCYVCDSAAPCELWDGTTRHCDASEHIQSWKACREMRKQKGSSSSYDVVSNKLDWFTY